MIQRWQTTWQVGSALLCLAVSLATLGCWDRSCAADLTCPIEVEVVVEKGPGCAMDPAEGRVGATCGVWVSSSQGDDAAAGTQAAPVASLAQAIALAGAGQGRVYACAESFVEAVVLPAGVSLFGGFACPALQWRYVGLPTLTELTAPADAVPLTLVASVSPRASTVTDFKITAIDATAAGGSSIAVLAQQEASALLLRCKLSAGNGAAGMDGGAGDHFGQPAKAGLSGEDGMAACSAKPGLGGEAVGAACEGGEASFAGAGGDGGELSAGPGGDGHEQVGDNPQGFGLGGQGEDLESGLACSGGAHGASGADGEYGWGGTGPGHLTSAGYVGVWGGNGSAGRPGQGGGGGGASAAKTACGVAPHGGAGGGSGGMGGCGGKGGMGGQPGGASIGIATLSSAVTGRDLSIKAGNGGNGGRGGSLQPGGPGGLPGIGGAGFGGANGASPGCGGGIGGYGGDGGHGGGGLGGPSLAIASLAGQKSAPISGLHTYGQPGEGGLGADSSILSSNGQKGIAVTEWALLP